MASLLIADDQMAVRVLLKSILSRAGHYILLAENGVEALKLLNEHPEIELLITDLDMPEMDGMTLLEELKNNTTLIKLVVTAQGRPEYRQRLEELGSAGLIEKPVNGPRLTQTVQQLLEHRAA